MITREIESFIQNKQVVVTGGAGFIGSNLVDRLLQIGVKKLIIFDDLSTGYIQNIEAFLERTNCEFVQGSIVDYDLCLKVFEKADIVFQLATLGSVPRSIAYPTKTNDVNVVGFLNVLNACKEKSVKKIVYSSSSSVYGDDEHLPKVEDKTGNPLSPYAVTKKTNELYAKVFHDLYEMDIVGLRYFNVFGPNQSVKGPYAAVIPIFIENLLNGKPCKINGDGTISRDFTYVQNVVEANICAAYAQIEDKENRVLNIAMGSQLSLNELYAILKEAIGTDMEAIHDAPRLGDIQSSQADISRAKKVIGYKPSYGLQDGLIKTIAWNKKRTNT